MMNDFDANGKPIDPPIRTPEEELAWIDPLGWARGEVRREVRLALAIWKGEPDPPAIFDHVMLRLGPRGSPGTVHTIKILQAFAAEEIAQIVADIMAEPR